ncbi:MAG TPA: hypothetical protein VGD48_34740 [Kutzneria sp.]|jgi:hypothetical protein
MTTMLDDFDLDIRIGDSMDRLPVMATTSDNGGCTENTEGGISCTTGNTARVCLTDASCHKTVCC